MSINAFKGFDKDLRCRGFQYVEGETYEESSADLCARGFHAVTLPLDVFTYYKPGGSRYHRVVLDGETGQTEADSKRVGRKITIGASLGLPGMVKAHVEAVFDLVKKPSTATAATTGGYANAATTGGSAHAVTTGGYAHAATTGGYANAATTGGYAHAATTGRYANAATTGYSDEVRASVKDETAVAAVLGQGAASGAVGSVLFLIERDSEYRITAHKSLRVDGKKYLADVFYTLRGGKVVEA